MNEAAKHNICYAVDRLYDVGWLPTADYELERLSDGRRYPSLLAVQKHFTQSGLELSIKQNLVFNCYHATWAPVGEELDLRHAADERHGTVVGSCEREAAVYAMAQLVAAQAETQLAAV